LEIIPPLILNLIQNTYTTSISEEVDDAANKFSQRKRIGIITTRKISSQENIVTLADSEPS
jgi:hypothetical protein